ncbi:MAG: hypothetical protein IT208_03685 [Chthonomonadales bacterium]|nr:hypothetical protein [Chthonomonadales bacterium]
MDATMSGKGVLLTCPASRSAVALARHLANAGARIAITGPGASVDAAIRALLYQFRRDASLTELPVGTLAEARAALARSEKLLGRLDIVLQTVGLAPPRQTMAWSLGAIHHLAARGDGHLVHLVHGARDGSTSLPERLARHVERNWRRQGAGAGVLFSAVRMDGYPLRAGAADRDGRLLENYLGRIVEEEDWADRMETERRIATLAMQVIAPRPPAAEHWFALHTAAHIGLASTPERQALMV